jgi:hypothetical protein
MALECIPPYPPPRVSFPALGGGDFRGLDKNRCFSLAWMLTCRVFRYHGTMDVQQERLNVYFNEVTIPLFTSFRGNFTDMPVFRLLVGNGFLELSLSIWSLERWMRSEQARSATSSVPTTLSLDSPVPATTGQRDSTRPQSTYFLVADAIRVVIPRVLN